MGKKLLFISCDEAKFICDKAQYGEASDWEKLKLDIRRSWCKITKAYYKRNLKLTSMLESAKMSSDENLGNETLSNDIKNSFKSEFEKALKEQQK